MPQVLPEIKFPPENLMPHQTQVIYDTHRFKVLVWHRRARKTSTAITEIIRQALIRRGVYWHIFPTYSLAKESLWIDPIMLFNFLPEQIILKRNEQELSVTLTNGSVIRLKGADDPDHLRGAGPVGVVFDEFQKQKLEAWQVVEPILRANNGWAWFIGTPAGKNHLFDFYNRGQHTEQFQEWASWFLKASTSGIISASNLEEARNTSISQEFYNQEYECAWLEGVGQVFRGVRDVATSKPQRPVQDKNYVMGLDLAKHQDYTVITVFDRQTNCQVYQDRFNKLDWPFQKMKVIETAKWYNNAVCVTDATGIGDPIVDDLARAGVAVTPFKITEMSKKDLIEKLSIWIEQRRFKILPIEETIFELENFAYTIGPTGKIRYNAPSGLHDDIVISLALAVSELNETVRPPKEVELNRLQRYKQRLIMDMEHGSQDREANEFAEWADPTY